MSKLKALTLRSFAVAGLAIGAMLGVLTIMLWH